MPARGDLLETGSRRFAGIEAAQDNIDLDERRVAMKTALVMVAAAGALAAGLGFAQSGADVLKARGCMNCHEMDKKKVGPSFKDVATKYKGDKGAPGVLVGKLKEGTGHPKATATDEELKAAVGHVLATK
jgi:cytochrome c